MIFFDANVKRLAKAHNLYHESSCPKVIYSGYRHSSDSAKFASQYADNISQGSYKVGQLSGG
jgi:hypothetical protein